MKTNGQSSAEDGLKGLPENLTAGSTLPPDEIAANFAQMQAQVLDARDGIDPEVRFCIAPPSTVPYHRQGEQFTTSMVMFCAEARRQNQQQE